MAYSSSSSLSTDPFGPFGNPPSSSATSGSYRPSSGATLNTVGLVMVPHRGSLCRIDGPTAESTYILEILLDDKTTHHELIFARKDFDFCLRLFTIMDTESRGQITKAAVQEFVTLRCPVFFRRDEDLERPYGASPTSSPTFEEVWRAVAACSVGARVSPDTAEGALVEIGVEGWMVMCRFIAHAQYLEAKRRFSGRHLQQTMRHRNAPRGSELVMVDVPPVAPPTPLTATELAQYEQENQTYLPLPELDLDHSLVAAHDVLRRRRQRRCHRAGGDVAASQGHVKIDLFGTSPLLMASSSSSALNSLEFCLTYIRRADGDQITDTISVRRSMNDMKWLHDTFVSQKALGGTLCGRILPPFPGNRPMVASSPRDDSSSGGAIVAAANAGVEFANAGVGIASAGVGILKEGFKSLWGGYLSNSSQSSSSSMQNPEKGKGSKFSSPSNSLHAYYNPNSPAGKARHLERYTNYLLEHPSLSTSFPLQAILKASQSGLEAARQSLAEYTRTAKEIKAQAPQMDDGKMTTFWSLQSAGSMQPNLAWVRTAAQAAVALQLHGVLETTGLPSASARLQHASLPSFDNAHNSTWSEDDGDRIVLNDSSDGTENNELEDSFEEGVMHVQDELESNGADPFFENDEGNGYDLLPLPVPAPERQILNVGEAKKREAKKESRYRYGSPTLVEGLEASNPDEDRGVYLGEMAIDDNIDKLREVVGSVDNTLSRCMASSGSIERSRRERLDTHLKLLRGLDSWEGLRGKFVNQRSLLKGVSGIEQSREVWEESDLALIDDISWQTALAHSAVSAAEDVRSTVRAARTASNAKAAATSAAHAAQKACDEGKFASIDDARAAQTRSSIAQSHAIHAAVVEHEAKTVKRRATLALAHDVKCWNAHRKREVLGMALSYAKSQHEATRRAVDAWSCLRDGFVGSAIIPSTQTRKPVPETRKPPLDLLGDEIETPPTATIFRNSDDQDVVPRPIVAVEHELFKIPSGSNSSSGNGNAFDADGNDVPVEAEASPPFVVASPILDADRISSSVASDSFGVSLSHHSSQATLLSSASLPNVNATHSMTGSPIQPTRTKKSKDAGDNEAMTSSMQSLVDGLMNWGGVDVEEDFALPQGMAASIAMEESGVFAHSKIP